MSSSLLLELSRTEQEVSTSEGNIKKKQKIKQGTKLTLSFEVGAASVCPAECGLCWTAVLMTHQIWGTLRKHQHVLFSDIHTSVVKAKRNLVGMIVLTLILNGPLTVSVINDGVLSSLLYIIPGTSRIAKEYSQKFEM